ncbi:MAG: O-antigen ligase family protein [Comamonadaceae bacterium]|nr:O-antigen ligase family protein [Comamonadaceae bacterium]
MALVLLEWLGLIVLLALSIRALTTAAASPTPRHPPRHRAMGVWLLALAPLWVGLLQLIPLPGGLWAALPGHAPYAQALAVAQVSDAGYRALSLMPDATWTSVLAGIPLMAAFLLACFCSPAHLHRLVQALVVFAVAQAVLGLLQMGPFPGLSFGLVKGGRVVGTFANRNHFASYITMTVPLAILLFRQATASARGASRRPAAAAPWARSGGWRCFSCWPPCWHRAHAAAPSPAWWSPCWRCCCCRSARATGPRRHWGMAGAAALLALVVLAVGLDALQARFESEGAYLEGERWLYVIGSWHAALAFWPFGSGLGSYASVFPAFQPVGVHGFIEHAHNDYVQLLMECGLLAVALGLLALVLIARQVARLVRRARRMGLDAAGLLQASCGLGLLAVLLHSWVDFNLRIPANAMLAAFLLGAFLRPLQPLPVKPARESVLE